MFAVETGAVNVTEQLRELERLADELGVRVSYEPMVSSAAGLCRVRGEYRLIIDRRVKPSERVNLLCDALGRFETTDLEMPEPLRRRLSRSAGARPNRP